MQPHAHQRGGRVAQQRAWVGVLSRPGDLRQRGACPVCAAKVQERRRAEIATGFDWAYTQGLQPLMITLTFPHRSWHKLSDLVLQQRAALKLLRAGAPWKNWSHLQAIRG